MNHLTPELKRLMRWAREAPQGPQADAPLGFSAHVVAQWNEEPSVSMFTVWQKAIWGSAWAATVVILLGVALLTTERIRSDSPYGFSSAYQMVATEFVP
jgi:hypothetical protein